MFSSPAIYKIQADSPPEIQTHTIQLQNHKPLPGELKELVNRGQATYIPAQHEEKISCSLACAGSQSGDSFIPAEGWIPFPPVLLSSSWL